jgi:hypothetical protein
MLAPSAADGVFCAVAAPGESEVLCASAPVGALAQSASAIADAPIVLIGPAIHPLIVPPIALRRPAPLRLA